MFIGSTCARKCSASMSSIPGGYGTAVGAAFPGVMVSMPRRAAKSWKHHHR
jgi:hypothetical protein